jgi:hypothetical protein
MAKRASTQGAGVALRKATKEEVDHLSRRPLGLFAQTRIGAMPRVRRVRIGAYYEIVHDLAVAYKGRNFMLTWRKSLLGRAGAFAARIPAPAGS